MEMRVDGRKMRKVRMKMRVGRRKMWRDRKEMRGLEGKCGGFDGK